MRLLFFSILLIVSFGAAAEPDPLVPTYDVNSAEPGSLYFATETPGRVVRAPLVAADVKMVVSGPVVRTRVVQQYTNTGSAWVEGIYTYPLPKGSAVDTLEMKVGERVIIGELKEKAEAKRTFEAAKREGKRASLVVQHRPNIFSTRLANIGPGETIEIAIEYQDLIEPRDNLFELRFPMVVRPRFNPGIPLDDRQARSGWGFDTDEVPDGGQITQPWLHDPRGQHNPATLTVDLAAGFDIASLASPSHAVDIHQSGASAMVTLSKASVPADQDFILRWRPTAESTPRVAHFREQTDKGMHHLLMLIPSATEANDLAAPLPPRDLTIVLDKSGSMSGQAILQAKSAVRRALMRLTDRDRVNLVAFDNVAYPLFATSQPMSDRTLEQALSFLDSIEAGGGTNMTSALDLALPGHQQQLNVPGAEHMLQQIIFVTDGAVGNEQALMAKIKNGLDSARLFTIGIGSAPNSYFMEEAAHFGRGTYINIAMNDDVRAAMEGLFMKIERPQITNLAVTWPEGMDSEPEMTSSRISDLYAGEPIVLAFRSEDTPTGDIVLTGRLDDKPWSMAVPFDKGGLGQGVSKLWARSAIKAINRAHIGKYDQADQKNRRDGILKLALDYHLVSDFTSLVAVEQAPARPVSPPLFKREVPANLPAGMDWHQRKILTISEGLIVSTEQGPKLAAVHPRSTATPMRLYLLLGMTLVMLAIMMVLAKRPRKPVP